MELPINQIICGPALDVLKPMPDGTARSGFSCSVSSPPYWALRDYGVNGQLGLEKTFEEYIDKLCTIYDEVKRVLRKDGCVFVNLGDTYGGGGGGYSEKSTLAGFTNPNTKGRQMNENKIKINKTLPAKSLCLIPQRFAIEMVNRGWILRNTIIWHKPNPMPSSAKDRFTVDFEYVYFFVKSKKYWFEPQYEPADSPPGHKWNLNTPKTFGGDGHIGNNTQNKNRAIWELNPLGRNRRTVWTIPTQPFPEAHFATYPEKLVEPMIKAGCPEFICTKCGKARVKIFEKGELMPDGKGQNSCSEKWLNDNYRTVNDKGWNLEGKFAPNMQYESKFIGYTDCNCGAEFVPGIVWDPFVGSGTTLQVAARLGRNYGGSELNPEYIEMAEKRIMQGETGIPVKEQKTGQNPLFPIKDS